MIKKLVFVVLGLVVLILVGAYIYRNILVEKAVEEASMFALGVRTDLGAASLEIGGGSLELDNFVVSNPTGFQGDHFMTMRRGMLDVETGSVLDDEIVIDSLIIEGVHLNLEQVDTRGNYKVLLDHINKHSFGGSSESEKTFRIGMAALRDISVTGRLSIAGQEREKTFSLENFTLQNLGGADGADLTTITMTLMKSLIERAAKAGQGALTGGFGLDVSGTVNEQVDKVKSEAEEKAKDLGKSLLGH